MLPSNFGNLVRERRQVEGWSQDELAEKIGISRNYLSQIERGIATNLSWQLLDKITSILGIVVEKQRLENLPQGLEEFAKSVNLPEEDILMLANLKYRGNQPDNPEKWSMLYNLIKVAMS